MRRWLAPTISIDLQEGGDYRIPGADGPTSISGVVLELVPEGRLVLSWMEDGSAWRHPGRLVIALRAEGDGTEVTLTTMALPAYIPIPLDGNPGSVRARR